MPTPILSVRLPDETRARLDKAAKTTHRSRSFLVKEALDRHLSEIVAEQGGSGKSRVASLLAMKGLGARLAGPQTAEQLDARIGAFRGDE